MVILKGFGGLVDFIAANCMAVKMSKITDWAM